MFDTERKKAFIDGWNKAIDVMQLVIEEEFSGGVVTNLPDPEEEFEKLEREGRTCNNCRHFNNENCKSEKALKKAKELGLSSVPANDDFSCIFWERRVLNGKLCS
jgi:hypothetical protein